MTWIYSTGVTHTGDAAKTPHSAMIGTQPVLGQGPGALIHQSLGTQHGDAPASLTLPIALDPDGFPSGRASNQRVFPTASGTVG